MNKKEHFQAKELKIGIFILSQAIFEVKHI